MAPSRPITEAQVSQGHSTPHSELITPTVEVKSDAEVIQGLRDENAKLREELRLSNAENQVGAHNRLSCPSCDVQLNTCCTDKLIAALVD